MNVCCIIRCSTALEQHMMQHAFMTSSQSNASYDARELSNSLQTELILINCFHTQGTKEPAGTPPSGNTTETSNSSAAAAQSSAKSAFMAASASNAARDEVCVLCVCWCVITLCALFQSAFMAASASNAARDEVGLFVCL